MKLTKKAAVKLSDHTPLTYLLSTSLALCNLKNGFRVFFHTLYVKRTNSQRHKKENAHRHSLQSFALILLSYGGKTVARRHVLCGSLS